MNAARKDGKECSKEGWDMNAERKGDKLMQLGRMGNKCSKEGWERNTARKDGK